MLQTRHAQVSRVCSRCLGCSLHGRCVARRQVHVSTKNESYKHKETVGHHVDYLWCTATQKETTASFTQRDSASSILCAAGSPYLAPARSRRACNPSTKRGVSRLAPDHLPLRLPSSPTHPRSLTCRTAHRNSFGPVTLEEGGQADSFRGAPRC
jgi:hypothetical protein